MLKVEEIKPNTAIKGSETYRYIAKEPNKVYGTSKTERIIMSKWRDVPREVEKFMEDGVLMVNGLCIYDSLLTILYGWNIPNKARRSWELIPSQRIGELAPMCLTFNEDVNGKVIDLWNRWKDMNASSWYKIYNKDQFEYELGKEGIKCYSYREPVLMKKAE